jgi:hypothetical protein
MTNKLHELTQLSEPIKQLCELAPKLDTMKPGIEQLGQFVELLTQLSGRFKELDAGVAQACADLRPIPDVIRNYVDVTSRAIQEHLGRLRR